MNKTIIVFLFDNCDNESNLIEHAEISGTPNQISGKISQLVQRARKSRIAGKLEVQTKNK